MSYILGTAKVFALISLFFVIAGTASAQSIYQLPAGTRFQLRMTDEISSKFSSANDTFRRLLAAPVIVRDIVLIPAGTVVEGRVLNANHAEFGGRNGKMEIQLETLQFANNVFRPIYRRSVRAALDSGVREPSMPSEPGPFVLHKGPRYTAEGGRCHRGRVEKGCRASGERLLKLGRWRELAAILEKPGVKGRAHRAFSYIMKPDSALTHCSDHLQ